VTLRENLRSTTKEKQQTELYLAEALLAGERLRDDRDSVKLIALQKSQEIESLSREVARLIRQSFAKGNEIADLKEVCDEHQSEIERLNEVIVIFQYTFHSSSPDSKLLEASKCASSRKVRMKVTGDIL
jgi:predicted  nucleic acid-binding Zn-ribbon protein